MGKMLNMKRAMIFEKPSGTIAIGGNMDIREKKFYNIFLKTAVKCLKKDSNEYLFTVTLPELKQALNVKEDDKNNTALKKIIKKMHKIDFEYNILNKDKNIRIEGYASLLDNIKFTTDIKTGAVTIRYSIPEEVRLSMIKKNGSFAKINTVIVKGLRSKHSVTLYELVQDYQKVEIPEMTIENFRKIFGVENKYSLMTDLKKRVLDVAVTELNDNENIDFLLSYELKKTGPKYTHIKFHVKPKPAKLKLDQQKDKIISEEIKENSDLSALLALVPEEYRTKKNLISLVLGSLEQKGKEYTQAQMEYTNKNAKKNYVAFLKKAIESDYAGVEQIEIEEMPIEEEDTVESLNEKYAGRSFYRNGTIYRIVEFMERDDKIVLIAEKPDGKKVIIANKSDNITSEFVEHALGLMEE